MEHRREFIDNLQYGKQIDEFLDIKRMQKRHRAQQPIFVGLKSKKSGNQVPYFEMFEKYLKFAHGISVQNGSYAFPNELVRFRIEAKAIWGEIKKHSKNAVII